MAVADDLLPDLARREIAAPVCSGIEFRELAELCLAEALRDALPHRSRVKLSLRDHIVTGFVPHELVRGIVRVIRADIHPVPGDKRLCADRASVLLNGQIPASEQNDVQPALLAEPLRGARRLRISAGHKANTGGLGAARNSERRRAYFFSIRERSCSVICGSACNFPALISSCALCHCSKFSAGIRTVSPFAAVASTDPAPDDEVAERFQPAADIRCFKRSAVVLHELSGELINVALPHGTGLRRGLPELSFPVLNAAFQALVFLPQRIQLRKVLGEFSGYFVARLRSSARLMIG